MKSKFLRDQLADAIKASEINGEFFAKAIDVLNTLRWVSESEIRCTHPAKQFGAVVHRVGHWLVETMTRRENKKDEKIIILINTETKDKAVLAHY